MKCSFTTHKGKDGEATPPIRLLLRLALGNVVTGEGERERGGRVVVGD